MKAVNVQISKKWEAQVIMWIYIRRVVGLPISRWTGDPPCVVPSRTDEVEHIWRQLYIES